MSKLDIDVACKNLHQGKVLAYPTEAVWGLGCDPENRVAVEKILKLKRRPLAKGLILVAADLGQLGTLLDSLDTTQLERLKSTWPGPTTWLIPDPDELFPLWIKGDHSSVAIRISAHPLVSELCRAFGKPIVSTSANLAGQPEIRSRSDLERQFGQHIDYIVDGELGKEKRPSEIRDLISGDVLR